jgi:hypothetical protein
MRIGAAIAAICLVAPRLAEAQCESDIFVRRSRGEAVCTLEKWEGYGGTFRWSPSLLQARREAGRAGRLVMHFFISGNLDEESC